MAIRERTASCASYPDSPRRYIAEAVMQACIAEDRMCLFDFPLDGFIN